MHSLVEPGAWPQIFFGNCLCAIDVACRIHRHGVNLDAQKSGVDQDLSRGIEFGDKATLGKSSNMKFRLEARGAVEGARCSGKVRGARGTRNVDVAMAIQPDAPDAGISRESVAILVSGQWCRPGAWHRPARDQSSVEDCGRILPVDAQPVFAQELPLAATGLCCAIHHLPGDRCRFRQMELPRTVRRRPQG